MQQKNKTLRTDAGPVPRHSDYSSCKGCSLGSMIWSIVWKKKNDRSLSKWALPVFSQQEKQNSGFPQNCACVLWQANIPSVPFFFSSLFGIESCQNWKQTMQEFVWTVNKWVSQAARYVRRPLHCSGGSLFMPTSQLARIWVCTIGHSQMFVSCRCGRFRLSHRCHATCHFSSCAFADFSNAIRWSC